MESMVKTILNYIELHISLTLNGQSHGIKPVDSSQLMNL